MSSAFSRKRIAEKAPSPGEKHLRMLVDGLQDYAVIMLDPHGRVVTWSDGACRLLGCTEAEIVGHSLERFHPAEAVAAGTPAWLLAVAAAEGSCEEEGWRLRNDGTRFFADVIVTALRDAAGELVGFASITRNISGRRQAEQTLREREERFRLIADNITDVIMLVSSDFLTRIYVSPACRTLYGYEPEELIEAGVGALVHPDDRDAWAKVRLRSPYLPENEIMQATYRIIRKDGSHVWVESSRRRLPGELGYIVSIRDISERQQMQDQLAAANRQLEILATRDSLTGLANRRYFDRMLDAQFRQAIRDRTNLSLLMIDVDFFKQYNDRYGHPAGDECLTTVSLVMQQALHRPNDMAARYGGEEFAILLPSTPEAGALVIAERIAQAVRSLRIEHASSPLKIITVSLGVASLVPERNAHRPADLVSAADRALYAAKAAGRDMAFCATSLLP